MNLIPKIRSSVFKFVMQLIFALLFANCLTPVDIPTKRLGNRLVVSGQISPLEDQNIIQLGRTADTERLPILLSGASITLSDDLGANYSYIEDLAHIGTYVLSGVSGIPGRTYHIQIELPTGEIYNSKPEKMPEKVGKLSTHYELIKEEFVDSEGTVVTQPFIKIYANTILPENNFMKWTVQEVYILSPTDFPDPFGYTPPSCFISQNADPQRITLVDGTVLKASSITNLLIGSRIIDYSFWERHYFTIYQSSLTKEANEFWQKVNILANQKGSIFDTPPAEITGNIYNVNNPSEKVFGYFQAVNQIFDRFYVLNYDLPFPLLWTKCTFDNRDYLLYPQRCLDCLIVRNSSYNRPSWF